MVASGICQTDLHVRAQHYAVPLPLILGHEGAGIVEAVGADVSDIRVGDSVLLSYPSCGYCKSCRTGNNPYCDHGYQLCFAGARFDGSQGISSTDGSRLHSHFFAQSSFSTVALADRSNVVRVDSDAPLELLAPLGCGIQTGAGAVLNGLKIKAGESLAVFGTGSVGLAAVMAGRIAGADPIIVVDTRNDRLEIALEVGATLAINPAQGDARAALLACCPRGVDALVDTTARPEMLSIALECLATLGTAALVGGAPAGTQAPIDMTSLLNGRTLRGIIQGDAIPQLMLPQLIKFHRAGVLPIEKLITFYAFEDINHAVEEMAAGRVIKPVLRFNQQPRGDSQ
jgi:aryl-alcohol dehydrogenase